MISRTKHQFISLISVQLLQLFDPLLLKETLANLLIHPCTSTHPWKHFVEYKGKKKNDVSNIMEGTVSIHNTLLLLWHSKNEYISKIPVFCKPLRYYQWIQLLFLPTVSFCTSLHYFAMVRDVYFISRCLSSLLDIILLIIYQISEFSVICKLWNCVLYSQDQVIKRSKRTVAG